MRGFLLTKTVQSSPCTRKRAKKGHLGRAGRVLYRKWGCATRAGRVLYRSGPARLAVGPGCAVGGGAPARRRAASFARRVDSLSSQAPPPMGAVARPFGPSGAFHVGAAPMSHVIPLQLLRTMKSHRCNCNVCGRSPQAAVGNYVRLMCGSGPAAARGRCEWLLRSRIHDNACCGEAYT